MPEHEHIPRGEGIEVEMVQNKRDADRVEARFRREGYSDIEKSKDIDGNMWHVSGTIATDRPLRKRKRR
jgi:hypothetical protein